MKLRWRQGNQLDLLVNGEAFYPAVLEALAQARREVLVETFILFDDEVGRAMRQALMDTARRGVQVHLTIDGYGSPDLPREFIEGLVEAGVKVHVFDPPARLFSWRLNFIHRLHRKIVSVDAETAFIGGINYSVDHLKQSGPESKQDYALRIRGPLAADIHADALLTLAPLLMRRQRWRAWMQRWLQRRREQPVAQPVTQSADPAPVAALVKRDNGRHRDDIERCYRLAIRAARSEVIIANAYFYPGYRLIRELRRAARRGVRVQLILQGKPDMAYVKMAAGLLYQALTQDGVEIHEYCERPLHGKVAVVDGKWVTVGSSNLDPLSLSLNLEANVVARDPGLAAQLRENLLTLMQRHCHQVDRKALLPANMWRYWLSALSYHVSRGFPRWLSGLQPRAARLRSFTGDEVIESSEPPRAAQVAGSSV